MVTKKDAWLLEGMVSCRFEIMEKMKVLMEGEKRLRSVIEKRWGMEVFGGSFEAFLLV
jgi:hypothetical protein